MEKKRYDVIVVGSGAGGSSVALELTKSGKRVLIIEAGPSVQHMHLGNFWHVAVFPGYYHKLANFNKSQEHTTIYCTSNVGGTTVFSCGNMVRSLEKEFLYSFGIDLKELFLEAEKELNVKSLSEDRIIGGAKVIMKTAQKLGYKMMPMPKAYQQSGVHCELCGNCVAGCRQGAKWDARLFVEQAIINGATLVHSTRVKKVLFSGSDRRVRGIQLNNEHKTEIECDSVILSAGALNTPVILQKSGASAGYGLFVDLFSVTYGIVKEIYGLKLKGMSMPTVYIDREGFLLSPFIDHWSQQIFFCPINWNISNKFNKNKNRIIGIMTKIADERTGRVELDKIHKYPTEQDQYKLRTGEKISVQILKDIGAKNIITTRKYRGAHPGGTAAIGEVVDTHLRVYGCEGLYVCDASVLPFAPGLPPILTIIALAKYLVKQIN